MLAWRFELVGLVIEKTEVVYLKSFTCIVVKKKHFKSLATRTGG